MAKYNALNVKLSNLQLNYLKSGIENHTLVTLKHSSRFWANLMMRLIFHITFY